MSSTLWRRPEWSKTFIEESEESKFVDTHGPRRRYQIPALLLFIFTIAGAALQACLIFANVDDLWAILPTAIWGPSIFVIGLLRPQKFSLVLLILYFGLFISQAILLLRVWDSSYDRPMRLASGTTLVSFGALVTVLCMPMRHPAYSRQGISVPGGMPTKDLRSPEDDLTFFQWATAAWVSPLLKLGRKRQLNEQDIWQLPYEYQHTFLHEKFRRIPGSVLRKLLVANWVDLAYMTVLEFIMLTAAYSEPVLLQELLRAMAHLDVDKRPAITYAALILLVNLISGFGTVFNFWYSRRAYERSRGQLIMMLYEKTLHRKIIAKSDNKEETALSPTVTRADNEHTSLLGRPRKVTWFEKTWSNLKLLWAYFLMSIKGVDPKKDEPAEMGKIMNLMRYDSYEVAQRFWDFQEIIEKPLGLIVSLGLAWRLMGWSAGIGVAAIVVGQTVNFLLAKVEIRVSKVKRKAIDKRLQQTSQYIEAIRHLRWYGWQQHWLENVFTARQREMNIKIIDYFLDTILVAINTFSSSVVVVAVFWAYTSLAHKELSVDIVFPALELFRLVQDNLENIPELIRTWLNANVALGRIQAFMEEPDKETVVIEAENINLVKASFAWPGLEQNVLDQIDITVKPGLNLVYGEVASGKTALLQAILGELDLRVGELHKPGRGIAYCSQTPWLQSMTIRDNILFNGEMDTERYRSALHACALVPDLASFEKGDLSAIGENGIGLSGGQKARVALARAIYSHAPVLLLDDPLSALDQQTAEHIVSECIMGPLLKGRTVILVTHRTDLCSHHATQLIQMNRGRAIVSDQIAEQANGHTTTNDATLAPTDSKLEKAVADKFEEEERREHGDIKASVYWEYLKAGNLSLWVVFIVLATVTRLSSVVVTWFLKEFSEAYNKPTSVFLMAKDTFHIFADTTATPGWVRDIFDRFPNPTDDPNPWLIGLLVVSAAPALGMMCSFASVQLTRYTAGKNMFVAVMNKITNVTFRYYDITPIGRLMNRLTSDIGTIDGAIGWQLFSLIWSSIAWVTALTIVASVAPLFLLVSILVTLSFVYTFFRFLPTSQSLRRLETTSLSPLMSNFGALLTGLTTVRAFRAEGAFMATLIRVVDTFQGMDHFYWSVQAWLTLRLQSLSAFSTFALTMIAVFTGLTPGLTAFVLVTGQRFVGATHALCKLYGQLQVQFVSVERIVELLYLEQEPGAPTTNDQKPDANGKVKIHQPPAGWPSFGGNIIFEDVSVQYAAHLPAALSNVNLTIRGGTNTALVGRTGSGKSTLAAALLATVPVTAGRILIDGIDINTVDRQALRSRVTFLAQDPVLFEGTLRHNLDPMKHYSETDIQSVIDRVSKFGWTLDTRIEAGGKNLSQGQRQLVGLARAILRRSSIIIMDEATASIDVDTAWEVQRVLREELTGSTVLTIAHRAAAVRGAEMEIRLADGKLVSHLSVQDEDENSANDDGNSSSRSSGSGAPKMIV